MATVLESLSIPRASTLPSAAFPPSLSLSAAATTAVKFSEFRGLKLTSASLTRSVNSLSSARLRRRNLRVSAESCNTFVQYTVPTISESEWESLVLESDLLVMVEFWAPWCGPCRMVEPLIAELSQQYAGKLKVYKVNTDDYPAISSDYGIRSIPTVILFKNGEKKAVVIGAVPKSTLTTSIEKYL